MSSARRLARWPQSRPDMRTETDMSAASSSLASLRDGFSVKVYRRRCKEVQDPKYGTLDRERFLVEVHSRIPHAQRSTDTPAIQTTLLQLTAAGHSPTQQLYKAAFESSGFLPTKLPLQRYKVGFQNWLFFHSTVCFNAPILDIQSLQHKRKPS